MEVDYNAARQSVGLKGEAPTALQSFFIESRERTERSIARVSMLIDRQDKQLNRLIGQPVQGGASGHQLDHAKVGHLGYPPATDAMGGMMASLQELEMRIDELETMQSKAFAIA